MLLRRDPDCAMAHIVARHSPVKCHAQQNETKGNLDTDCQLRKGIISFLGAYN